MKKDASLSYSITPSGLTSSDYLISYVAGGLTIRPAPLTIVADDQTQLYGSANPPLTVTYFGFVPGDSAGTLTIPPSLSTTAGLESHVGTYPIQAIGADSPDYAITYVSGSLTVAPAPLVISADDKVQPDGSPLPALTASYTGLVDGDTPSSLATPATLSTMAREGSPAGPYPISASGASSPDYTITYRPGILTVQTTPPVTLLSGQLRTIKVGRKKLTGIVLGFSGALDSATAQAISNYHLVTAGKDKKFGTKDDKSIALKSAAYDASRHAVTILPKSLLPKGPTMQLRVNGSGLKAASGRPIDGDRDGRPGGDAVSQVAKGRVRISRTHSGKSRP